MSRSTVASRFVAVVALAVAFAASTVVPGDAQARQKGPRLDSVSKGCGDLQDAYDQGVRDLEHASKYGTQAQYDAALESLKSIIRQWNGSICAKEFGSLLFRKLPQYSGHPDLSTVNPTVSSDGNGNNNGNGKPGLPTLAQPVKVNGIASPDKTPSGPRAPSGNKLRSVLKKN